MERLRLKVPAGRFDSCPCVALRCVEAAATIFARSIIDRRKNLIERLTGGGKTEPVS